MYKICNEFFDISNINHNAIFIGTVGYEERSYYLYEKFREKLLNSNVLVFAFKRFVAKTDKPNRIIDENIDEESIINTLYDEIDLFYKKIEELVVRCKEKYGEIELHIDYSYMPRQWYCKLPSLLSKYLTQEDKVTYWYAEGEYPNNYNEYPTAGINSFVSFSGKASLRTNLKRTHLIALSYDTIRTEGVLSILDPEMFVACSAYDSDTSNIKNNVYTLNESVISRANLFVSLHMDDFQFMLSKLCEIANDFYSLGDVILIPDGPKPLIFAMSLVPEFLNRPGITCLHITRNNRDKTPIDVTSNGKVIGFSTINI